MFVKHFVRFNTRDELDDYDFIDLFDKQYFYTTTEEEYHRQKPKPFEFEVNVI